MAKAIFLDRDGVINIRKNRYITSYDDFEIISDVSKWLKKLYDNNFKLIVVTNQSAIAKGLISINDLENIHKKMQKEFSSDGFQIDRIYYCPHADYENCSCRKPKIGLFEKAISDFSLDKSESWLIGDEDTDIEAGRKLGCKTIKINTNSSLCDAVKMILDSIT